MYTVLFIVLAYDFILDYFIVCSNIHMDANKFLFLFLIGFIFTQCMSPPQGMRFYHYCGRRPEVVGITPLE